MICCLLLLLLTVSPFTINVVPPSTKTQIGSTLSLQYKVEYPAQADPEVELLIRRLESERLFLPFNVLAIRKSISTLGERKELLLDIDIQLINKGNIKYSPGFLSFSTNDYLLLPDCTIDIEALETGPLMQPFLLPNPEAALKLSAENRKLTFVDKALQEGKSGLAIYALRTVSWEALTLALLSICCCLLIFWLLYEYDRSRQKKDAVEVQINWKLEFTKLLQNKDLALAQRFDKLAYILWCSHALEKHEDTALQGRLDEIRFAKKTPTEEDWQFVSERVLDIL